MVNTLLKFLIVSNIAILTFATTKTIVVAGGCFWCMEAPFDKLPGVLKTTSGYAGGKLKSPTYHDVSSGSSGHLEVVEIAYDDSKISLKKILETFWRNVNPTDAGGQFVDRGPQYATGFFFLNEEEKKIFLESKKEHQKYFKKPIVTEAYHLEKFYPAEDYHQDYYKTNPIRYKFYRYNSGRDQYLQSVWKK